MKYETVGVVILFVFFALGAAAVAYLTYEAFGSPGPYTQRQIWHP